MREAILSLPGWVVPGLIVYLFVMWGVLVLAEAWPHLKKDD